MNWILLFVMPLAMATNPKIDKEKCTCNGYPLYGRVQVVETGEDLEVKIVEYSADLEVKIIDYTSDDCGYWRFVESAPDVRIRFVEYGADLNIKFVEYSPGLK